MACDVLRFLPPGDSVDEDVERIVHLSLELLLPEEPRRRRRRRTLTRPGGLEIQVASVEGDTLWVKGYRRQEGDLMAELFHDGVKVRALHTHSGHRNPDGESPLEDGHMHFPTRNHPLDIRANTHAYPVDCDDRDEVGDFVMTFCALLGIGFDPFNFQLGVGGGR